MSWGHEVLLVDTTRVGKLGIGQHGRKTDRIDAEVLARAVESGHIPIAHVLSPERRELRMQLAVRRSLVDTRSQVSAARAPFFREAEGAVMMTDMKTRRSAAQWAELVAAWDSSGLSAEAFARERGLVEGTLRWWKGELESRARGGTRRRPPRREDRPMGGVRLARVVRQASSSGASRGIVIQVGAARVVVEGGFDPRLLRELIAALEGV